MVSFPSPPSSAATARRASVTLTARTPVRRRRSVPPARRPRAAACAAPPPSRVRRWRRRPAGPARPRRTRARSRGQPQATGVGLDPELLQVGQLGGACGPRRTARSALRPDLPARALMKPRKGATPGPPPNMTTGAAGSSGSVNRSGRTTWRLTSQPGSASGGQEGRGGALLHGRRIGAALRGELQMAHGELESVGERGCRRPEPRCCTSGGDRQHQPRERLVLPELGTRQPADVVVRRGGQLEGLPQLEAVLPALLDDPDQLLRPGQPGQLLGGPAVQRPQLGVPEELSERQRERGRGREPCAHRRPPHPAERNRPVGGGLESGERPLYEVLGVRRKHRAAVTGAEHQTGVGHVEGDPLDAGTGGVLAVGQPCHLRGAEELLVAFLAGLAQVMVGLVPGLVAQPAGDAARGGRPADLERRLDEAVHLAAVHTEVAAVAGVGLQHRLEQPLQLPVAGVGHVPADGHLLDGVEEATRIGREPVTDLLALAAER